MKKIKFTLVDKDYLWVEKPTPAIKNIPEWYRKMSSFFGQDKLTIKNRLTNQTAKRCIPLMESMTAGYHITLPADIMVSKDEETGNSSMDWATHVDLISTHNPQQTYEIPIPEEYASLPFKFVNFFIVKTPPGYSTLFVHPLNRYDLPFYSFSGLVDTDKHSVVVHFPFVIRKDFEGIIPKGTPIIQAIPIKRENWKSIQDGPEEKGFQELEKYFSNITRAYKKIAWSRKQYE